ncbi:serine hydrolase domain-containing protein [Pseudoalteromonas caenipelagi]|uniref:serine hydrolase domain-containing protein n=1 Tax=Pseudoalteromonas caenipelagi TaxID=2726988 RepID=UPI0031B5BA43
MIIQLQKLSTGFFTIFIVFALTACKSDSKLDFDSFVDKKLTELVIDENAQVASIAIVGGNNHYQKHFGKFPDGTKPNSDTVYEIASITKTYTGLVLAQAVADKKVQLDEDIRVYLGDRRYQNLAYSGTPITLRHLATHRSGLPLVFAYSEEDKNNGKALELLSKYSKAKFFEDLSQYQLTSEPGDEYLYSNVGADLVGYILEKVYNQPFSTLIAKFVTEKSGEQQTKFRLNADEISKITTGTDGRGNAVPLLSPHSFARGGLTSTVEAISSYMQYLLSSPSAAVALSQSLLSGSNRAHGQAFFWNTYKYDSNKPVLYHSGGSIGTSSWLGLYPKQGVGIFIVTNVAGGNTQEELNDIADAIIEKYEQLTVLK